MPVNWAMGVPQGNAGEAFQQSYQNALLQGQQAQDRQMQMQQREQAQVQQKQQQQVQLTERHQRDIRLGAGIARQIEQRSGRPMDDAGWQQVRQAAQQAGADLTDVPEHFDPNYYQGLLAAGAQIEAQAQRQQAPTTMQRNADFIEQRYGAGASDQYMTRQTAPPPIVQRNDDGTITIIPQATAPLHRRDAQPQQVQPVTRTPEQLRADAAEAIRQGADPAQVQAELARMLGGANPAASNDPAPAFGGDAPLTVEDRRSQYPAHAPGRAGPQGPRTFR